MFYQPRRGGSKAATRRVFRREPPRLRQLRWLRDIPLMAQPPQSDTGSSAVRSDSAWNFVRAAGGSQADSRMCEQEHHEVGRREGLA